MLAAAAISIQARAAVIFTSDEGKQRNLYSVDPGGEPRQLTKNTDKDLLKVYNMYPAISADRTRIAYASYRVYVDEGLKQWREWNGQPLYPEEEFYLFFYSYFPTRTYYTRHKSLNWNIYMMDLRTGREWKLSNFLWDEISPQFFSRGSDVIYVLTAEKSVFVLRGSKSGKSFKQITLKNNSAIEPQISPDGRQLLYQSYQDGNWELYTMRMADLPSQRIETRLTRTSMASELHPRWAPDGKRIYYIANTPGAGMYDLYLMDLKTKESRRLTEKEQVGPDAAISPSGDRVAYTSKKRGRGGLVVTTLDGKDKRFLTMGTEFVFYPTWSPDGSRLAFLARSGGGKIYLYSIAADGTNRTRLADTPCSLSPLVWY